MWVGGGRGKGPSLQSQLRLGANTGGDTGGTLVGWGRGAGVFCWWGGWGGGGTERGSRSDRINECWLSTFPLEVTLIR